jgi:hypothetical protein
MSLRIGKGGIGMMGIGGRSAIGYCDVAMENCYAERKDNGIELKRYP